MKVIEADAVERALDIPSLVEALRRQFREGCALPTRHHHTVPDPGGPDAVLLLMPAWQPGEVIGVKVVTVFPGNGARGLPAVIGSYLLMDGAGGTVRAVIDGPMLTVRRTAAASALASTYLSREDASVLCMVGTGALAPHLIEAHCAVRPIGEVRIWGRDPAKAAALAERLAGRAGRVIAVEGLRAAVAGADVVSCATLSRAPLVQGAWLKPGAHLDLVGAYSRDMRESDDECVRRADIYVDTMDGALAEAGDLLQPMASGALPRSAIRGDLFGLTRGEVQGRSRPAQITLFKSVGTALEDLAAARLVQARAGG